MNDNKWPSLFREVCRLRWRTAASVCCVWGSVWVIQSEQIHLLRVCISLSFPSLTPRVAVVIHDDRGCTNAAALGAVPMMTLMATVTRAVQAMMPPTHLVTSARQPFCMHVAHFVLSPSLINISSLFAHSPLQLQVWLSWKKDTFWWSICFLFRFFSLKILWIRPWSNYRSMLGRYVFIYSPIMWALWNLSTLELWLMALQVNSTWSIVHHGPFLFIGLCQPWQEDAPCLNMIHKLYQLFYPDIGLLHRLVL